MSPAGEPGAIVESCVTITALALLEVPNGVVVVVVDDGFVTLLAQAETARSERAPVRSRATVRARL